MIVRDSLLLPISLGARPRTIKLAGLPAPAAQPPNDTDLFAQIAELVGADVDDPAAVVAAVQALADRAASAPITTSRAFITRGGRVVLSASELTECRRAGAKPRVYAENKAIRMTAKGRVR